ncbi:MAG: aldehyde dehydrogenase family protein, partial [Pseudomonadota bacterium]|nr:aldehyde dehydrogenase family protein [Pseudomonadota bacterium]
VTGVRDDMRIAQEEIFGPILPLIPYENIDQAIEHVNARPRPLALYLFESDRRLIERVVNETTSGGACVNDTMLHISHHHLPFGGIGPSGLGAYHGHRGFLEFSHQKGVLYQGAISPARWLRPPYGSRLSDILNRVVSRMS